MSERTQLNAERARCVAEMRAIHTAAENREWTPEEEAKFASLESQVQVVDSRLMALEESVASHSHDETGAVVVAAPAEDYEPEMVGLQAKIEAAVEARLNKLSAVSVRRSGPAPVGAPAYVRDLNDKGAEQDRRLAFRGWMLGRDASRAERAAADRVGLDLNNNKIQVRANTTTLASGGYTIPAGFLAELEKKIVFFNPLRTVSRIIPTLTGNSLPFPTIDDTANSAAVGVEATAPSATDMTFAQVVLGAYRYESLIVVSNELLRDSGLDLATEVASLLGERIGRKEATDHTTGNGTTTAQGVVTGASTGTSGATATTITLPNIMALRNSLDFGYQQNASFMMHQTVWNSILQLADGQSRPLFLDLLNGNAPRLLGYPVIVNNAMASSIATTNVTVLFGDFSKYYIRDAGDIEIVRLNERYADAYATGFLAVRRTDAKVAQSAAIKKLTQP